MGERASTRRAKTRAKVRAHRERLRRRGLRPVQFIVPDVRSREFVREAHRQSLLVPNDPADRDTQGFLDAIAEWPEE